MTEYQFHAPVALLPSGWAEDVSINVARDGRIVDIRPDSAYTAEAVRLAGPALPGMVNVHSHTFQRAIAGLAERAGRGGNDSFWTWRERMYALVQKLTPEHIGAIAHHVFIEMLKSGTTGVAEFHYLHHAIDANPYADRAELSNRILAAAQSCGLPITLLPTLYTYSDFGQVAPVSGQRRFLHDVDTFLRLLETVDTRLGARQNLGIAFHSLRAVTVEQIEAVLAEWPTKPPIHIHIAEQQREVEACVAWARARPVAWLFDNVPVGENWCLIHATHLSADECARLARAPVTIGLCPTTEANLGDGIFPGRKFIANGGRFAVGSDSQVCLAPAGELRQFEYTQRLESQQRNCLHDGGQVGDYLYQTAAHAGAQATQQPTGAFEVGKQADFVVLDGDEPMLAGCEASEIASCWMFAGTPNWIRDVWIAGERIVADRRHPQETEAARGMAQALRALAE